MDELLNMKREANDLCEYWYQLAINAEVQSDADNAWAQLVKARQKRELISDAIDAYLKVVLFDVK